MSTDTYIYINKIEINILRGKLSQGTPMLSSQKTVTYENKTWGCWSEIFLFAHGRDNPEAFLMGEDHRTENAAVCSGLH